MTPTEVATAMLSKVVIGVMNISDVMYPLGPAIADVEGTPIFLGVSSVTLLRLFMFQMVHGRSQVNFSFVKIV
jgi:hypothetical protein